MKKSLSFWEYSRSRPRCWPAAVPAARNPPAAAGAPVLVATAFTTNVPVQIDPPPVGHVTPYSTVTVHSQIGGIISRCISRKARGEIEGDLLFTIDPRPSQAALARRGDCATGAVGKCEHPIQPRPKTFRRKNRFTGSIRYQQGQPGRASGTVAADASRRHQRQLNLEFCRNPRAVRRRDRRLQFYQGNVVKAPDDTLVTINQIHPIYVAFAVPEQFLPEIRGEMHEHPLKVSASFENMNGRRRRAN